MKKQYNYINKDGKLIYGDSFADSIDIIHDGCAVIEKAGKYNIADKDGGVMSDMWLDYVYNFRDGFAKVKLNGKSNYINKEGEVYK